MKLIWLILLLMTAPDARAAEPLSPLVPESEALVQRLIDQTGRRANLITVACNELLYELGSEERKISREHLERVLDGSKIRNALAFTDLSMDQNENRIDRITRYAAASDAEKPRFTLSDIITRLKYYSYSPPPEALQRSL